MRKIDRPQKSKRGAATIETIADIRKGVSGLRKICPAMRRVHDLVGDPPLRRLEPGFAGLAQVVVGQQLSVASAGAIWKRTAQVVEPFEAATLLRHDVARLRAAGLSQGKVKTLRAIADAIVSGALSLDRSEAEEDLREALLAISGVGPWTADIYVMFCLGAQDGFAAGDLALQLAAQRALGLDARPGVRELVDIAERWRPWRGIAARLLWSLHAYRDRDA
ncbi:MULTISPECIES: DNA-3-methyladenine glycosylase family protein [Hyphomicrobium]|uniref:DNA-3-methyladenine glycosylase family protein n=1 Tax=Hyphomicrobium TaxID=81 RepID=UPI00036DA6FC|nr:MULTISPECIES: DNA-3-methyladenine glycosylase [Hyphomicrobium]WBT39091.1 DNA-3-methyladenine glycosylase [Hyphomicrobium sp. DMF-1]